MKSIPRISSCFAFAAILAAFLFALPAATAADSLGDHVGMISVPAGLSSSDVQGAIVTVLSVRQWGIKEKGDDRVVGYLKHRSNEATLTLVFDTTKIDLYCVGSRLSS